MFPSPSQPETLPDPRHGRILEFQSASVTGWAWKCSDVTISLVHVTVTRRAEQKMTACKLGELGAGGGARRILLGGAGGPVNNLQGTVDQKGLFSVPLSWAGSGLDSPGDR